MLKDKVIIISGGTSGIGYAAAKCMAATGAIVYACVHSAAVSGRWCVDQWPPCAASGRTN